MLAEAGVAQREAEVLVAEPVLAGLWHAAYHLDKSCARFVFTWLTGPEIKLREEASTESKITPEMLVKVAKMNADGKLSTTNARELLTLLRAEGGEPAKLATTHKLLQESDEGELGKVVDEVIAANAAAVADYKAGNQRAFGSLVGAAMKATQGRGNPPLINKLLKDRLG